MTCRATDAHQVPALPLVEQVHAESGVPIVGQLPGDPIFGLAPEGHLQPGYIRHRDRIGVDREHGIDIGHVVGERSDLES